MAEIQIKKTRVRQSLPEVQIRIYIAITGLCSFSESNCTSVRHKRHDTPLNILGIPIRCKVSFERYFYLAVLR